MEHGWGPSYPVDHLRLVSTGRRSWAGSFGSLGLSPLSLLGGVHELQALHCGQCCVSAQCKCWHVMADCRSDWRRLTSPPHPWKVVPWTKGFHSVEPWCVHL